MLERSLPIRFDPAAEAPNWCQALDVWFPADKDGGRRAALQEFFGYICLAHAKYKRALVLYGESNTGKSVPVMVAKALVGEKYTCQLGVSDMDDPTRRAVLKGKALNIMTELSADALINDGGFKTLVSTEEPIMLDQKYVAAEMYTPTSKHVIATNNLPRINDHTSATFNRLLIIPFDQEIPEKFQDRNLLDRLKQELPGILRWAADGAARLLARQGQWPEIEASNAILNQYRLEMNPMEQFVRERLERAEGGIIPTQHLAHQFNLWNIGHRNFNIGKVTNLLKKALRSEGAVIKSTRIGGRVIRALHGYQLAREVGPKDLCAGEMTGTVDEDGDEIVEGVPVLHAENERRSPVCDEDW